LDFEDCNSISEISCLTSVLSVPMSNKHVSRQLLVRILLSVLSHFASTSVPYTLIFALYYCILEWYKDHGYVPEIDDLTQIYDVLSRKKSADITDDSTEEQKQAMDHYYVRDMDLLIWYLD
jgi:hypothetical protein